MNKIRSDEVEDIAFITPAWKSLSILPSLLDLLIGDPIFIPLHQLVGPLPTQRPFNVMLWFHFSLLGKKSGILEPTIQALLEIIDHKTLSQH